MTVITQSVRIEKPRSVKELIEEMRKEYEEEQKQIELERKKKAKKK